MRFNQDHPLYLEIIEANREAIIKKEIERLRREYKELLRQLPWYLRVYVHVITFLRRVTSWRR